MSHKQRFVHFFSKNFALRFHACKQHTYASNTQAIRNLFTYKSTFVSRNLMNYHSLIKLFSLQISLQLSIFRHAQSLHHRLHCNCQRANLLAAFNAVFIAVFSSQIYSQLSTQFSSKLSARRSTQSSHRSFHRSCQRVDLLVAFIAVFIAAVSSQIYSKFLSQISSQFLDRRSTRSDQRRYSLRSQ